MESALDVLSRAATMIQDNANEARLTSKELPTTAWRRERRLRTGEYHHPSHHHHSSPGSSGGSVRAASPNSSPPPVAHGQLSPNTVTATSTQLHSNAHQISMMMAAAVGMRPLCESTNRPSPPPSSSHAVSSSMHLSHVAHTEALQQQMTGIEVDDAPLDMSVSSSLKQRHSPPPPYREPLPGSQFASSLPRPSVITQAPPKRDIRDSTLIANRENDNRSSESIDEHFRRSLGNDYFALFAKKSPTGGQSTKTPSPQPQQPPAAHVRTPPPAAPPSSVGLHPPPPAATAIAPPPPAYPNNLPPAHQQQTQSLMSPIPNSVLLSPAAVMAVQMKGAQDMVSQMQMCGPPNSPPLPLVVRPPLQQQPQPLALQRATSVTAQTPLPSPQSPTVKVATAHSPISSTAGSRTASPLPNNPQPPAMTLSRFTSVENSPSSSPRHTPPVTNVAIPNASPNLPAIMRVKTEPGLQSIKTHNPTPPASPTSTTNPNIMMTNNSNASSPSPSSPSPSSSSTATIKTNSTTTGGNSSAEVLASVDDHFAKALGDTWKRLQESKEMRK